MRKRSHIALAVAVIAGLAAPLSAGSATAQTTTPNLVVNPGFEVGTTNWYVSSNVTLSRVAGYSSNYAARLKANVTDTAVLNDGPDTVTDTVLGATYTASAWVRTPNPKIPITLRLKEFNETGLKGQAESTMTLSTRRGARSSSPTSPRRAVRTSVSPSPPRTSCAAARSTWTTCG